MMENKPWLHYWYPDTELDIVKRTNIEYKSGLILLLSVLCGLCTIYYSVFLDTSCSTANIILSIYFFSIPIGMKNFGRWNIFGMAVCIGWTLDNVIIAQCHPAESISLSFYQSLIPSYFILASEEYIFGGFFVSFLLMFALPYEYSGLIETIQKSSDKELRVFIENTVQRTQTLNLGHMLAVFGLTMWMHSCSNNEYKLMKRLWEETKQAKQAAEMFFAAFSHEFRNPLNSLLGSLELIKDDMNGLEENLKELVSTSLDCGEVLSNLINNVLDVSKIQAQMFQPAQTKVQPRAIFHKVFSVSKAMCIRKGLTLILDIDKNLPNFLLLDGTRLTQVLINLVSNAIKFTEQGFIKIRVVWKHEATNKPSQFKSEYSNYVCIKPKSRIDKNEAELPINNTHSSGTSLRFVERSTQTLEKPLGKECYSLSEPTDENFWCWNHEDLKGELVIEVEDSGIGISEENRQKLFNPYTQANSTISKIYGGTGLGLWISKTIVQVYKGSLSVNSTVDKGSNFTIQLPVSVCTGQANHLPLNSLVTQNLEVLLLDNQFTKLNKKALEDQGLKVSVCISSYVATKYLTCSNYNFIFIGLNFLKDSPTLAGHLLSIEKQARTPIIVLVNENQLNRVPTEFKSYSALVSPLSQQDISKLINFLYQKSIQKLTGLVLVLDDDRFILDILGKILEKEKILHSTFMKGLDLVEVYKKQYKDVALVVVDANLVETTGFEIAGMIRSFEKFYNLSEVPIICISGSDNEIHMKKCKESGICYSRNFYVVTKPVKRDEYINTIKRFLRVI